MGFNVSSLSDYTHEFGAEIVTKMLAEGVSFRYATPHPGIKSSENVNRLTVGGGLNAGANCGFNATGSSTFDAMTLTVDGINYQDEYCMKTLEQKALQYWIKPGSKGDDTRILSQKLVGAAVEFVQGENEKLAWAGNKTTGSGTMARTNGWLKYLRFDYSASTVNTSGYTGFTAANCDALVDHMIAIAPAAVRSRSDMTLTMGTDAFSLLMIAYKNAKYPNILPVVGGSGMEIKHPIFQNVTIVGTPGLDASNNGGNYYLTLGPKSVFYYGCDQLGEDEKAELWWSQDDRVAKLSIDYRLGFNILWPQFVVIHKQN